ncbi:hypothetical protein [Aquabacterium sp.]|uniref:hypothetical protein n=1 Tax=Aquabacterium sp. TaxID=1872578 RepID=UPI0035B32A94
MSTALESWGYTSQTRLRSDSPINPDNIVLRVPVEQAVAESRLGLRWSLDSTDAVFDFRAWAQRSWLGPETSGGVPDHTQNHSQVNLTQGFVRIKRDADTVVAGRELLTWGPATFRSPSNPFYFDAGRTQPLAAISGVDLVRATHGAGPWRLTLGNVFATSEIAPPIHLPQTRFAKVDYQGEGHLISINVALRDHEPGFVGAFAQYVPSDEWLLYSEVGNSSLPAPSGNTWLAGASYTLENGHVLTAEWLHNSGGLRPKQLEQLFDTAQRIEALARHNPLPGNVWLGALPQSLLDQAPRLFGRNYLWLGWQSNPQDTRLIWRAELTSNITDGSGMAMLYVEKNLWTRLSAFVVLSQTGGGQRTEFGSTIDSRLTIGAKVFAF